MPLKKTAFQFLQDNHDPTLVLNSLVLKLPEDPTSQLHPNKLWVTRQQEQPKSDIRAQIFNNTKLLSRVKPHSPSLALPPQRWYFLGWKHGASLEASRGGMVECVWRVGKGRIAHYFFFSFSLTEQDRLAGLAVSCLPVQSYHLTHDVFITKSKNRPAIWTLNRIWTWFQAQKTIFKGRALHFSVSFNLFFITNYEIS